MKHLRIVSLLTVMLCASVVAVVTHLQAQGSPPAAVTPGVSARTVIVSGQEIGEVLVGDTVIMRLTARAGGYTPGQRANVVASRLTTLLGQGYSWQDLSASRFNHQAALLMGNNLVVTVARGDTTPGVTPMTLASQWQNNAAVALRGVTTTAVAGTEEQWPAWTNPTTKIVPIVSAGTPGVRLGAAQVTGPAERVNDVDAVLQLDLQFQRVARIYVYVPSTSLTSLNRVQGVAVTALLQYRLVEF